MLNNRSKILKDEWQPPLLVRPRRAMISAAIEQCSKTRSSKAPANEGIG
jgi:hypothetical protein